jgi:hypothetical protein
LKDGAIISGATSASYTTPPTDSSDSGTQFAVVVGNPAGNVNSNHAWLTVNGASHALTASASSLKFSNVNVGSSSTLGVAFKNTENSDITIAGVSISGAGINANGISSGLILNPGQTANLNVTFAPAATGGVTGAVNVTTDVPGASTSITLSGTGVRAVSHSATLAWAPSTASTITGYNLYRATVSGGYTAPLNSSPISLSTAQFTDSTVQAGQTYYYVFTFVDSNNVQSTYSNEVSATIPTQ